MATDYVAVKFVSYTHANADGDVLQSRGCGNLFLEVNITIMVNQEKQKIAARLQTLANRLEQHMHAQGLTEDSLAVTSGISKRTIGNFLRPSNRKNARGTSKSFPSGTLANLIKIANALDVDPGTLICDPSEHARARFHAAIEAAYEARRETES